MVEIVMCRTAIMAIAVNADGTLNKAECRAFADRDALKAHMSIDGYLMVEAGLWRNVAKRVERRIVAATVQVSPI